MPGTGSPGVAVASVVVAAALMSVGCGGTKSIDEVEEELGTDIRKQVPLASERADCPKNATVEDGQSFTCTIGVTEVERPEPGQINPSPSIPKTTSTSLTVVVKVEGDDLNWKLKE